MSLLDLKSKIKCSTVILYTYDARIELQVDYESKGRILFESICTSLGLRETWYFALQYDSNNNKRKWLKMHKKLSDIKFVPPQNNHLYLIVKFYPENTSELIQEYTQHLFYLQVRDLILKEEIECDSVETLIKLASFTAQSKYGDLIDVQNSSLLLKKIAELELPKSVANKFSIIELEEKLRSNWTSLDGLFKEEAELEYLKLANSLEMFGVTYVLAISRKKNQIWLGICSLGIRIYLDNQKLYPKTLIKWSDIIDLKFSNKKIKIKFNKKNANEKEKIDTYTFLIEETKQDSKTIPDLCIGYYELYHKRRNNDNINIQQMKQNASEIKARRDIEKAKILNERRKRLEIQKQKEELEEKLREFEKQLKQSIDAQKKAEDAANILNERVKLVEEEAKLLSMKSTKLEAQVNLYKLLTEKKERERRFYEYKTAESELILNHIIEKCKSNTTSVNSSAGDLSSENLEKIGNQFGRLSLENNLNKIHKLNIDNLMTRRFEFYRDDLKNSQNLDFRNKLNELLNNEKRKSTPNLAPKNSIRIPNQHSKA